MKPKLLLVNILTILALQTGCLYAVRYDGPYHGKVVDQETREPIEGVVVLGTWSVYHFSVAGGYSTYHDAREAVTDKNGEFVVTGEGLRILSSLQPMRFIIFKAGYKYYEGGWDVLKTDISIKKEEQVMWEGDVPVFPLRKLTAEERRKGTMPSYPDSEAQRDKKANRFMEEIEEERIEHGYK